MSSCSYFKGITKNPIQGSDSQMKINTIAWKQARIKRNHFHTWAIPDFHICFLHQLSKNLDKPFLKNNEILLK